MTSKALKIRTIPEQFEVMKSRSNWGRIILITTIALTGIGVVASAFALFNIFVLHSAITWIPSYAPYLMILLFPLLLAILHLKMENDWKNNGLKKMEAFCNDSQNPPAPPSPAYSTERSQSRSPINLRISPINSP